jgi:hypothetical protein
MGDKNPTNYQSNRPESGGANKDERLEKSKIIDREVEKAQAHNAALRDDTRSPDDQADGDDDDRLNVIPDENRRA